jgi:hypothetical protein
MPHASDPPDQKTRWSKIHHTTVPLWSLVVVLALASLGYIMPRAITGVWPWQYIELLRQKRRVTIPSAYAPLTWADFLHLPVLPTAYGVAAWETVQAYAAQGVSLEGYIAETLRMPDGDLHLHLRSSPSPQCFPKGHREAQIVTEVTPHFQPPTTGWSGAVLRDLCDRQRRVRLAGWLMHDFPHAESHTWRATAWEIHPVTRIEVWDDARHAWQLVP